MRSHRSDPPEPDPEEHGAHTVRIWRGAVVGIHGDDVFVDLGPRMQGVISLRHFEDPPRLGEEHDFTVLGQEDGLWALSRSRRACWPPGATWSAGAGCRPASPAATPAGWT